MVPCTLFLFNIQIFYLKAKALYKQASLGLNSKIYSGITLASKASPFVRKYSNNSKDNMLFYYLAGLLEGDGHFYVPKGNGSQNNSARIEVIFALKDTPSAEFLKKTFGGNIYIKKNGNSIKWAIQDQKSIIFIVNCINGKLRTPKINAFHKLIDFFNQKQKAFDNIIKLPLDNSPINSNAWLTGFIDSDGCFSIKGFSSEKLRTYLGFQFYLPQRVNDVSGESLEKVMQNIADFLNTKLRIRTFKEKYSQFVVNTSSIESNKILINYLNAYPLLSSKYLDYKDWEKALNFYIGKLHRDPAYLAKIRSLKLNMNIGRNVFNWDHIENSIYKL